MLHSLGDNCISHECVWLIQERRDDGNDSIITAVLTMSTLAQYEFCFAAGVALTNI